VSLCQDIHVLPRINLLVDRKHIEKVINRYYHKGETLSGAKHYSESLLVKMLLLGIWNNLSYVQVEIHVNDSLSAMRFCGLSLEDRVPGHSTLSRFRGELTANAGLDGLLSEINGELSWHQVIVNHGVKVDASLTESPRKPKCKIVCVIAEDRREEVVQQKKNAHKSLP
jgi:IS5 family transposase